MKAQQPVMKYRFCMLRRTSKFKDHMISWKSLKISIAGAKLSHLVQKDKAWDHGSMVEQVRTVAVLLKKAFYRGDPEIIKKCLTESAFKKMKDQITRTGDQVITHRDLEEVSIIDVAPGKNGQPDRFTASLKFKKEEDHQFFSSSKSNGYHNASEQWLFVRQGGWWLLDEVRAKKIFPLFLHT